MGQKKDWWTEFFPSFRPIFDILPKKESSAEAGYIIEKLGLKPGRRFLDCPCGIGRISIPLARRGVRVTGVDITKSYLEELSEISKRQKLKIELVHADMRSIKFRSHFDGAGNIGTSLGYFKKDSDNQLVLGRFFRALKPGGKFMLQITNRDWIIKNFTNVGLQEVGGLRVIQKRRFDYAHSAIIADWTFLEKGRERTFTVKLRLYSYHELISMMHRAGFVDIQGFGSVKDDPIDFNHRSMFIIGTKPK
jgi:ubiquinone/menaquinone biosynthesis C-methylase UbiE